MANELHEIGWLISLNKSEPPMWFDVTEGTWTADPLCATRLARLENAERVIRCEPLANAAPVEFARTE